MTTGKQIKVQGQALSRCCADTLELIARHAPRMREIIEKREEEGLELTVDDLLWLVSEKIGHDITKEV